MVPETLVVPLDLGDSSGALLDEAVELAKKVGAKITALHVVEPPAYSYPQAEGQGLVQPGELDGEILSGATRTLCAMVDARRGRGVELDTAVRSGVPWEQIEAVVRERNADLVVVGTHARRGLARALLGSVAENVIRTVGVPVLVIPQRR